MPETSNLPTSNSTPDTLPEELVREPDIPVPFAIAEALTLQHQAMEDKDQLMIRKLDWTLVESLRDRALALQEADTNYLLAQFGNSEILAQWKAASTEGIALREELIHGMQYAFDGDDVLLEALRSISQGSSFADLSRITAIWKDLE